MADEFSSVDDLMDLLSPRGMSKIAGVASQQMTLQQQIRQHIVDKQKRFGDLKKLIESYFTRTQPPAAQSAKDDVSFVFHGISLKSGSICTKKPAYNDSEYWVNGSEVSAATSDVDGKNLFKLIFPDLAPNDSEPKCDIAIMTTTDPYISPTDARTEDVEMFLNYTPSIVAAQMQPYLEIQFVNNKKIAKSPGGGSQPGLFHLNTPSILRFMLGSIDMSSKGKAYSSSDRSLLRVTGIQTGEKFDTAVARSGMEMFLMPQSFTNMTSLKAARSAADPATRIMDAKPFLPFASVADFEVTVLNAGAGAMAHKTANLVLVVHDKSRLSEISEFIRGPAGYANAQIWTSYGWMAPRRPEDPDDKDDYAKFINDTMHMEDCWQVRNTQFSFDGSGRVTLTLELVSFGVVEAQRSTIKLAADYEAFLRGFEDAMKEIASTSQGILNSPLGPDARIVQIVNAGSTGQLLPGKVSDPDALIDQVVRTYAKNANFPQGEVDNLVQNLKLVLNPKYGRAQLKKKRADSISSLIKQSINGTDPFLALTKQPKSIKPTRGSPPGSSQVNYHQPSTDYFSTDLINEINKFKDSPSRDKLPNGAKPDSDTDPSEAITLEPEKKIVSFGKLFCSLALPAFLEANNAIKQIEGAEVQVIFYALNDECGPVSGASVAEFPVDVERMLYAIDDVIKAKNRSDLTIEEFLRIAVNNQFNDDRSIGYGMLSSGIFEPWHRDKRTVAKAEKDPNYETNLAAWQAKYPAFKRPMIEMVFETSKREDNTASRIHNLIDSKSKDPTPETILRIHIYDKQNNPRKLFTQFVEIAGELDVGAFNQTELRKKLKEAEPGPKLNAAGKKEASQKLKVFIEKISKARADVEKAEKANDRESAEKAGAPAGVKLITPEGVAVTKIERSLFGPNGFRAALQRMVPTINVGTNGTMVKTITIQSKTDDLMAAANLVNIMKPKAGGNANSVAPPNNLEGPGGMPLRAVPASVNMSTVGCPAARLYQQYFIDLGTGTSLDNLYTCTTITHKISQGKFESTFSFAFTDGYGKFTAPPTITAILKQAELAAGKMLAGVETPQQAAPPPGKKPGPTIIPNAVKTPPRADYPDNPDE